MNTQIVNKYIIDKHVNDLAIKFGFTENELKMLKMFWAPMFNDSWIYVSNELVENYMGMTSSKYMMRDFHERNIDKGLIKDKEYCIVSWENPIVQEYFRWADLPTGNKASTHVNGRKYYIISGIGFKKLIMAADGEKGREVRNYYIKVEDLAKEMKTIIEKQAIELYDNKIKTLKLEHKNESEERENEYKNKINEIETKHNYGMKMLKDKLLVNLTRRYKTENFYMASNMYYGSKGNFKFGVTDFLKSRLSTMNTSHMNTADDVMKYVYIWKCRNSAEVERRFKRIMVNHVSCDGREFMHGPYLLLVKFVNYLIETEEEDEDAYIEFAKSLIDEMQEPGLNYLKGCDWNKYSLPGSKIPKLIKDNNDVIPATPIYRLPEYNNPAYTIWVKAIKLYLTTLHSTYDYDMSARTEVLNISWADIKEYVGMVAGVTEQRRSVRNTKLLAYKVTFDNMKRDNPLLRIKLVR